MAAGFPLKKKKHPSTSLPYINGSNLWLHVITSHVLGSIKSFVAKKLKLNDVEGLHVLDDVEDLHVLRNLMWSACMYLIVWRTYMC